MTGVGERFQIPGLAVRIEVEHDWYQLGHYLGLHGTNADQALLLSGLGNALRGIEGVGGLIQLEMIAAGSSDADPEAVSDMKWLLRELLKRLEGQGR